MESAIPAHLQTARTRHRRVGDDYAPPYPSFVARHKPAVTQVVMAYFGLQIRGTPSIDAKQVLSRLALEFAAADDALGPGALCRRGRFHQHRDGGVLGRPA
jgi:aldoxime dehydratase